MYPGISSLIEISFDLFPQLPPFPLVISCCWPPQHGSCYPSISRLPMGLFQNGKVVLCNFLLPPPERFLFHAVGHILCLLGRCTCSCWSPRKDPEQMKLNPWAVQGKNFCLSFQWSSGVADSWWQPIFTAYCHPGLGTVPFCCQERILSPSCWIHLCFS